MNYALLAANNNRAKAYVQHAIRHGCPPDFILILHDNDSVRPEQTIEDMRLDKTVVGPKTVLCKDAGVSFDPGESVLTTAQQHDIPYTVMPTLDVNSSDVKKAVSAVEQEWMVYAGPGGTILREPILQAGVQFLHVHPGALPGFRGSTPMYYSLLLDSTITCSVIIMSARIDEGDILFERTFSITDPAPDLDYVVDPCVRAAALVDCLSQWDTACSQRKSQSNDDRPPFYICHPVLRHIALLTHHQRRKEI